MFGNALPEIVGPHYKMVELPTKLMTLDRIRFKHNPDREAMMRRPYFDENITTNTPDTEVLVIVHKCEEHGSHRAAVAFFGKCAYFNLNSDEAVERAMDLIVAEPDGKGN